MRRISKILFSLITCLLITSGCTDEPTPNEDNGEWLNTLRLRSMDIAEASGLAIIGTDARSRSGNEPGLLYKMDADGNLTAVKVEIEELEDGHTKTVSTDYSIRPDCLFPLGDRYIYMYSCIFVDSESHQIPAKTFDETEDGFEGISILVNKYTGKIYYIPQAARNYFPKIMDYYDNDIIVADDGTFYMNTSSGVVKIEVTAENALVSTFGPQNTNVDYDRTTWSGGGLIPLDNGAVIQIYSETSRRSNCQHIKVLYQNGGFETFDGSNSDWHSGFGDIKDEFTCCYENGKVLAVKRPASNFKQHWDYKDNGAYEKKYDNEEVELSLVEINIGSSYGNITVGRPFFNMKGTNYVWCDYTRPEATDWTEYAREMGGQRLFVLGEYYLVGNVLAINKNTHTYIDLVKEGISEHVIIPEKDNVYHGKAWHVYSDCADWFDPETLTYGRVSWEILSHVESYDTDIKNGKFIMIYLNPADGSRTMRTINIETGEYDDTPVLSTQKIVQLIPLN